MQTAAAKAVVKEILDLEAEAKAYGAAWAAVANNYVVNDEPTDFKQDLEGHATRLQPSLRSQPCPSSFHSFIQRLRFQCMFGQSAGTKARGNPKHTWQTPVYKDLSSLHSIQLV